MTSKRWIIPCIVLVTLALLAAATAQAGPPGQQSGPQGDVGTQASLGTGFTYQGQLKSGGEPVSVDDVIIAGVATAPVIPSSNVAVNNLTINRDAVLDLTDRRLTVAGTLTNNETLKRTQDVVRSNAEFLRVTNQPGDQARYCGVAITASSPCYAQISSTPGIVYTTVQAAVDAANEGDTVKVTGYCSGVNGRPLDGTTATGVVTQVVYISKTITIRGGYTTAFTDPPDPEANPTTLDAGGQGRVLYVTGDVSPTIEGLRITGGDAAGLGGGVYVITATATISNNQIFGNSAGSGGGLYLYSSAATLDRNTIISNTAWQGGGLYLDSSDATLTNNVVADNQANTAGSGLYIKGSIPGLLHTTIARNGGGDGSGVYVTDVDDGYSAVALTNSILVGHTVGITVTAGSTATLGATLWGSEAWANEDDWGGEGYIYITGGPYNNIQGPEYSIATLNAVSAEAAAEPFILDDRWSISHGNRPLVAGSYPSLPDLVVERIIATSNEMTVIIRNQGNAPVTDAFWVDVYIDPDPAPTAVNQIWSDLCQEGLVWGITADALPLAPGEDVTLTVGDAYYVPSYSQISWPLPAGTPVYAQADSANVATNYGAVLESDEVAGSVYGDPAFVNPDAGDYHIGLGSAAVDAGVDAGVSTDIDGDSRPQGTAPDLGADEHGGCPHLYLPLVMRRWPPLPETPVLNAISNPDGDDVYTVSWGTADLASTYTLQEDDNSSFSNPTTRYTGSGTSWNASGQSIGTYYYRVRANNSWGSSGWSNVRSVTVQTGWVNILTEDFEGSFPGNTWTVIDNDPASGRYYWGKRDCRPHTGSYSAWNAGAGDTTLSCGSYYRNDMDARMIYGPFSLADATAAELTFDWWSDTELCCDTFWWGASTNGDYFYGTGVRGNWSSWTTGERMDLGAVPGLGSVLGRNRVWIAFVFSSNGSVTDRGSFVDNVVLRKRTGGTASTDQSLPSPQRVLQPDQTVEFGVLRLNRPGTWDPPEVPH